MKLKKREITLNEADSLKDLYYTERTLAQEYEKGESLPLTKRTGNGVDKLLKEAREDCEKLLSLWKKSVDERI